MLSKAGYVLVLVAALSLSGFGQTAAARSRAEAVLAAIPEAKTIEQVAISPSGSTVAYVAQGKLTVAAVSGGPAGSEIAVPYQLSLRDVAWSSDGKQLAFIADQPGETPAAQVWVADANGANPQKLADLKGYVQAPRFSPDGKTLALLFIEGIPRIAGPLQPETPLAGVVEERFYEQRITTIDLATKDLKQVSPADVYVYEYDWLPEGSGWAATAAHGSGDNNWWIARLYTVARASGELKQIYQPKLQIAQPRVSPDGKNIAFLQGLMSDEGLNGGEIYVIPTAGGSARNLTPGVNSSPSTLDWTGPDTLVIGEYIDGNTGFAKLTVDGSAAKIMETLWSGPEFVTADTSGGSDTGASFSRDGSVSALIRQAASTPPEVWAGAVGAWKQVSHLNTGLKPTWGEAKNVHWQNGDTRVQGWLLLPANYDASKKYPLVVTVHGGPSWACSSVWKGAHDGGELSAMEYFVLCPNPRGSFGQGEAYTQGNVKDFGGGDLKDIMAGIDVLAKLYPVDDRRLGIYGHSYGGYMTMWAETQTTRFAAAVAGAGISDWLSYTGENDIDEWMVPFFGASIYDDVAVYAKSDPMQFVKNVKTPTLIIVGDRDGEVPMPQSLEWWHALKALGVPVELVVYPNEGHAIGRDPAHARDYKLRTLAWFEEWFTKVKQ
ncbi:MAG: S9 family peptidase [Acidobacteriaceae bacterium]